MTANPFADIFYIDLMNPLTPVEFKAKKHQFRDPKLRAMQAAGFGIEKHGSWYEVWHNKLMPGVTEQYRTLREIPVDYFLGLVK
tara:strand:+ start:240 stop:491 length:252 start_codon:yes stop_codon:yes gene_type:complete